MALEDIIIRMDELKEELDQMRPLREDHLQRLMQKLKLEWNYHSNSIEGNTLSMSETKSFLLSGITAKGKPFRDYLEMRGHNDALHKLYDIVHKDLKITESLIKEFHKMILVEPYADELAEVNPGEWKTIPNYLITLNDERIDFESPEDVPRLMSALINWLNNHIDPPKRKRHKYNLHPLLIAAGFHVQFIKIHPFGDGNGRMARILTNLIFMLCGYVPAIVKLENGERYYDAINVSSLHSAETLAEFLGAAVIETLELSIRAGQGKSIEEPGDLDKELKILNEKLKARGREIPVKSAERVQLVLEKGLFPFFDKVMSSFLKFDEFFEKIIITSTIGGVSKNRTIKEVKEEVLKQCISDSGLNSLVLIYSLKEMKNVVAYVSLGVEFCVDFLRGNYVIEDSITSRKLTLRYNQYLSEEKQEEWVNDIQKFILAGMKNGVDR